MKRIPITSSNLAAIGYDPHTKTLEVEFKNGMIYQYDRVPVDIYAELMNADSHGSYFARNVKNAGFAFKRIH
ncbi:MAG TPA: KTSC domain-containing protein [Aggregatilineales bacterium]|nr:KTSC domain-containing protein [Aggregatilineales bacterium]